MVLVAITGKIDAANADDLLGGQRFRPLSAPGTRLGARHDQSGFLWPTRLVQWRAESAQ